VAFPYYMKEIWMKCFDRIAFGVVLGLASSLATADVFNMPSGQTSIQMVTIGDAGNAAGPVGSGRVDYNYQIDKYDVTASQYAQFLNAVAKTDTYGLWNSGMALTGSNSGNTGILRTGSSGSYVYTVVTGHENFPATFTNWGNAARFANWLSNGQPTGAQGAGTTETGSYTLNGANSNATLAAITRNTGATYVIPSENEWYKAAWYKGGGTNAGYWLWPTASDSTPSNVYNPAGTNNANFYNNGYSDPVNFLTPVGAFAATTSAYGLYDMGGDVFQWTETNSTVITSNKVLRGVSYNIFDSYLGAGPNTTLPGQGQFALDQNQTIGFRVAFIPEPASALLMVAGVAALSLRRRRA
jgi:formylglycine-generating enzyme